MREERRTPYKGTLQQFQYSFMCPFPPGNANGMCYYYTCNITGEEDGGFLFNANDLRDPYMREVVFLDYFELKKLKVTKNYCV